MPGRPIRSLVAEDRSAGGVRDQTGPGTRPEPGLVHVWSTRHRNRAVRNGLQRYIVSQVASAIQGEQAPGQNPDKDEAAGSSPARPTTPVLSYGNAHRWSPSLVLLLRLALAQRCLNASLHCVLRRLRVESSGLVAVIRYCDVLRAVGSGCWISLGLESWRPGWLEDGAQKLLDDGSSVATVSMSRSLSYSFGQTRSMWRL